MDIRRQKTSSIRSADRQGFLGRPRAFRLIWLVLAILGMGASLTFATRLSAESELSKLEESAADCPRPCTRREQRKRVRHAKSCARAGCKALSHQAGLDLADRCSFTVHIAQSKPLVGAGIMMRC